MMGDSSQRFMLKAAVGRMATYDTRFGPALTTNIALGYAWPGLKLPQPKPSCRCTRKL